MGDYVFLNDANFLDVLKFCNKNNYVNYSNNLTIKPDDILVLHYYNYLLPWSLEQTSLYHFFPQTDTKLTLQECVDYIRTLYPNNKIILDNLSSPSIEPTPQTFPNAINLFGSTQHENAQSTIYVPYFFWFQNLSWTEKYLYNYNINKTFRKKFFLPMRSKHEDRELLLENLNDFLPDVIYSAVWNNINLPNDCNSGFTADEMYFNADWYNDTYYSIVVEANNSIYSNIVTEKTMKAIAYSHPFMILAKSNHLKLLKSWNFETYDNLFDESYDDTDDLTQKIQIIKNNVENYSYNNQYDALTLQKIQHNFENFKNISYLKNLFETDFFPNLENLINSQ